MKMSLISVGDKVAGIANVAVVCLLRSAWKEMIDFKQRLKKSHTCPTTPNSVHGSQFKKQILFAISLLIFLIGF